MLSGIDRAVGPVHPSEQAHTAEIYRCPKGTANPTDEEGLPQPCLFVLRDGGPGKTFAHCIPHDYQLLMIDWTAPHFGGGPPLPETINAIRDLFARMLDAGYERVDPTIPNTQLQRFGDIFNAIVQNLQAVVTQTERGSEAGIFNG